MTSKISDNMNIMNSYFSPLLFKLDIKYKFYEKSRNL